MSSNLYFTVSSWFPGNGRLQPHFNTHWRGQGRGGVYYPPIPKVLTALGRYAGNEVILCKFVMLRRSLMCILELPGARWSRNKIYCVGRQWWKIRKPTGNPLRNCHFEIPDYLLMKCVESKSINNKSERISIIYLTVYWSCPKSLA